MANALMPCMHLSSVDPPGADTKRLKLDDNENAASAFSGTPKGKKRQKFQKSFQNLRVQNSRAY